MIRLTIPQIRALCYADVFGYPLSDVELTKSEIQNSKYETYQTSDIKYHRRFSSVGHYLTLRGREELVPLRQQRERYSRKKITLAHRACRMLRCIPTVSLIAVTGSVAMLNADTDDDIDILVVTKTGWLWTTRFFVVGILDLFSLRRKPESGHVADTICTNMFIDEDHMEVPENERDIFSAHEVAQARIVWSRGNTADLFYQKNAWVRQFLPGFNIPVNKIPVSHASYRHGIVRLIEFLFQTLQLAYMRKRRSNEIIKEGYVRFHPKDAREWILRGYRKRLRLFGLE